MYTFDRSTILVWLKIIATIARKKNLEKMPRGPSRNHEGIAAWPAVAKLGLAAVVATVVPGAAKQYIPLPENFVSPKLHIELDTPQRDKVAQVINLYRTEPTMRVRQGAWEIIAEKLKSFGASIANYKKIGAEWLAQFVSGVDPVKISLHRDRKGKCGAPTKLTTEIGACIVELQGKYKGGLSRRRLAGKLAAEKGIVVSEQSLQNWLVAMGSKRLKTRRD